jgi:hypothetical protein
MPRVDTGSWELSRTLGPQKMGGIAAARNLWREEKGDLLTSVFAAFALRVSSCDPAGVAGVPA